jgi:hypothetical protein
MWWETTSTMPRMAIASSRPHTPQSHPRRTIRYIPTLHIFFYLAGHPGDDEYDNCAHGNENIHNMLWTVSRMWRGVLAMAVGMLPFDGPESGQQSLGETMPKYRHTLERVLALLVSRGLAPLFGLRILQIIGYHPLSLGLLRLCRFPEIHSRSRYFKALMLIENPLYVLGTSHVNDPEAERMAQVISYNLRLHHRSKRDEGLAELVIGAKVG